MDLISVYIITDNHYEMVNNKPKSFIFSAQITQFFKKKRKNFNLSENIAKALRHIMIRNCLGDRIGVPEVGAGLKLSEWG